MKSLFAPALASALASVIVPSPQAEAFSPRPQPPMAMIRVAGGMPVPGGISSREFQFFEDGSVVEFDYYPIPAAPVRSCVLARIESQAYLSRLSTLLNKLQPGPLAFVDPTAPPCVDAPRTAYSVERGGSFVEFAAEDSCRQLRPADGVQRGLSERAMQELNRFADLGPCQ